jgi:hypothetical protein
MPIYEIHNPGQHAFVLEADSFTIHEGSVTFRVARDNTQVAVVYVMPGTVVVAQTVKRPTTE